MAGRGANLSKGCKGSQRKATERGHEALKSGRVYKWARCPECGQRFADLPSIPVHNRKGY